MAARAAAAAAARRPEAFSQFLTTSRSCIRSAMYSTARTADLGQPSPLSHPELLADGELTPGISSEEYISRRQKLIELLPEKGLAIIASAPVKMMTDVVPYTFRQDSDYLYITGCLQPGGVAVLSRDNGLCMFMPERDPYEAVWQGEVAGVDAAFGFFKADKAYPLSSMQKILPDMIGQAGHVFHNVKTAKTPYSEFEAFRRASSHNRVKDLSRYMSELRWIKSPSEIRLMRKSASIACQALLQTMLFSREFPEESKLSAKVEYECKMRGAQRMAFNPVVGSGNNGSIVHYARNDKRIREWELVLMDIGCEYHGYLSDLTRTWSPFGRFSPAQENLYSLILETNKECIKLCKPGTSVQEIHEFSVQMLTKGLRDLRIMKTESQQMYNALNPTAIGHYLGMDIHDAEAVSLTRPLKPGVVITIEPGIYIPSTFDVPDEFRGTGIRIEDEVLITETGYEVLTASMPKEISHLNSLINMRGTKLTDAGTNASVAAVC